MEKKKSYRWIAADLIFMYIVTGLGLVLTAFLMEKFQFGKAFVNMAIIVIYVLSCWIGGLIAGKKRKVRKFLWGLFMGVLYFLILFGVSVAISGGLPEDMVHTGTTLLVCMAAGTLGGMLG